MKKRNVKVNFKGGLTKRWLFQSSTIIVAVLLIICVAAAYFIFLKNSGNVVCINHILIPPALRVIYLNL